MPDTLAPRAALAAPTLLAPVDGAVSPLDAVTFRWAAPPGASAFDLRVATAAAPGVPLAELGGLATTETTLSDALPAGDLVWWVRQTGGAWSAGGRFRAGTPADVEVVRQAPAARPQVDGRGSGTAPLSDLPPDPVWPYAQGSALDGASALAWSDVPGFEAPARVELREAAAAPPRPLGPLGGEVVDAVAVSLQWEAVPRADDYDVELSPHAAFDRDVLAIGAGTATEIALPGVVPAAGHRLLWRVRARLGDRATAWSRYGRFYPAGIEAADRFRAELDAALAAQRRQRDHAQLMRQRELDLIPLHERPDAVTTSATLGAVLGIVLSSVVILAAAALYALAMP